MAIDPTAARPSSTPSDNPTYLAGWVCYINGREVPIYAFETNSTVWEPPTMRIHLLPDVLLMRLGHEDRVPVVLFYLDHWVDAHHSDFRLLGDGEILGWQYTHSKGTRTVAFTVTAHIHVFQQLYFQYMTNIDDIVASRSPELVASSIATTPGPIYPYALYHQGLNQTAAQIEAATPRPGVTVTDTNPDAETPGATQPIQAPYELVYNAIKGCIDASIPNERRSLPMMNFFARHIKKTRFHNRWVRLPILEDPSVLAGNLGVFPIFKAAANTEALNAMQRHVASQVGNSGPVWNLFQQTLGLVYMEIGMIPNPCSVLVQLNDTSGGVDSNPVDGRIIGYPTYDTPLRDQRPVNRQLGPEPAAPQIYNAGTPSSSAGEGHTSGDQSVTSSDNEVGSGVRLPRVADPGDGGPLYVPDPDAAPTNRSVVRPPSHNPPGTGVVFPRVGAGGAEFGIDPLTPIRLAQNFVKPTMHFAETPACNVIFPSMVDSWTYDENYLAQPTRVYINDSVMTNLLRADGPNREFMLHALTVGFPEEADALLHHKVGASQDGAGATAPTESGKNLLLWPEEFFKGPVTARAPLPAWFQFLRQFANSQAASIGAAGGGGPAIGTPPSALTRAPSLLGGHASGVTNGLNFAVSRRDAHGNAYIHAGSDISAAVGTPVYAVLEGKVTHKWPNFEAHDYGNALSIKHPRAGQGGEDVHCLYMHLLAFASDITVGRTVHAGDLIGWVGRTNGNRNMRDCIRRAYPAITDDVMRRAMAAVDEVTAATVAASIAGTRYTGPNQQVAAERVLAPFLQNVPIPATVNQHAEHTPWDHREGGIGPADYWRMWARYLTGLFKNSTDVHVHLEVIYTAPGVSASYGTPTFANRLGRVDAVQWLATYGIALGTGQSHASSAARRGRIIPPAPPPPNTPAAATPPAPVPSHHPITASSNTSSPPGVASSGDTLPSAGVRPQITTVSRNVPRVAPNAAPATPGSGGAGAPPTTTTATPASAPLAPAGTAAEGDSFAAVFRLYAQQEYLRQRYAQRAASVNMRFNPYLVAGFPGFIFDNMSVGMHAVGYVQSVSHSGSIQGSSASLSTSAQFSYCRMFYEFIADVRADAQRFAGRVTSAPAELISEIREVVQDEGRAEQFYKKLLYGGRDNLAGACFRWTEAMGYSDGGQVIPIEMVGESVAVQEERLRAVQAATRGEGNAVGAEQGQANPATSTQSAVAGGVSSQGQSTVRMNLDPNKELSPRNNIYADAFRNYHVAMRLAARPACTIDEYVRFYHGGKTIGQLQRSDPRDPMSPQVGQLRTDFSYRKENVPDFVSASTRPDGTASLTPGLLERPYGSFYDHIYRLVPGPGRNAEKDQLDASEDAANPNPNRARRQQDAQDRLRPPLDEEQGFTSPPAAVLPTPVSQGLPANYPQTRADWDTVLDLYREKVRTRVSPSR